MTKIIDVLWFSGTKCIGIVCTETDQGERRFYIGKGEGLDEERDKRQIADWGMRIDPQVMQNFFKTNSQRRDNA